MAGVELKITCANCIYGRDVGGGNYGCASERRRVDRAKLVNNPTANPFKCDYAELFMHPYREG